MHITLNIDTEQKLSAMDLSVLRALTGTGPTPAAATSQAASPSVAAPVEATTPEPEVDLLGDDSSTVTLQDAIDAATAVVAAGEPARIKAALDLVGAEKVRLLTPEQVAPFLEAL